jgi:hypothetical protein
LKRLIIPVTVNGSGDGSATSPAVIGKLFAIEYQPGTLATGSTVTITSENGGYTKPLVTQANAGTAARMWYPRDLVHAVADGAALTGTSGGDRERPLLAGPVKVLIASGGASTSGKAIIYYED